MRSRLVERTGRLLSLLGSECRVVAPAGLSEMRAMISGAQPRMAAASHALPRRLVPMVQRAPVHSARVARPVFLQAARKDRAFSASVTDGPAVAPEHDEIEVKVDKESFSDDELGLESQGLSEHLIKALKARGIDSLFPIQQACLKYALDGRDIIARARTGSGKTLAFSIPVIEHLLLERMPNLQRRGDAPLALVMAPTRELAKQVENEIESAASFLRCLTVYGGTNISAQERALRNGVDIVVGTPGRLMDLVERGALRLDEVRKVVLDEADQMLDMGFREDMDWILSRMPEEGRQTLLFSATTPHWVKHVARDFCTNPVNVDLVGDRGTGTLPDTITCLAVQVPRDAKRSVLPQLIMVYGGMGKTIVFAQTKREADEVAAVIAASVRTEVLHGDISQATREVALKQFRDGRVRCLVATDVAARGLDIPHVDLVVHYEVPNNHESFLHRSGRTGRAGKDGTTVLMYTPYESRTVDGIMRQTHTKCQYVTVPSQQAITDAAALTTVKRLDECDDDLREMFRDRARLLLTERDPVDLLSRALAEMSGLTGLPPQRSLLTMQEGLVTMRLTGPQGSLPSPGAVLGNLRSALGADGDALISQIGRVHTTTTQAGSVAIFDVPEDSEAEVLTAAEGLGERGMELAKAEALAQHEMPQRNNGRGRDGGRGGRGGYGRGRSNSPGRFRRNGPGGRGGRGGPRGDWGGRDDRRSYGGGSRSRGGSRDGGSWGGSDRSFGNKRTGSWDRSSGGGGGRGGGARGGSVRGGLDAFDSDW
ncbi:unnamed protein product [Pedinophyceae sp. YPF-701]|nr:unnamed protein product [Pedinophyceae sp. YPF-701]